MFKQGTDLFFRTTIALIPLCTTLFAQQPRQPGGPRTCKSPSTELTDEAGNGLPGVTTECTLEIKKNKPTVKCKFTNTSGSNKRFLYCLMMGTASTKGYKPLKMPKCQLCEDGDVVKCKPQGETISKWQPGWHFGCKVIDLANNAKTTEEFSSDEDFEDEDGTKDVSASDFLVSYADVYADFPANKSFDANSCDNGAASPVPVPNLCTECDGIGRNRFINTGTIPVFVEWVLWLQPFEDPYYRFQSFSGKKYAKFYVPYTDIPCVPRDFPIPIRGMDRCTTTIGSAPPISVDINLFDTFTMAADPPGSVPAYLSVVVDSLPAGVQIQTDPPEDEGFNIPLGEELMGTLTVIPPPSLKEGTRMRLKVVVYDEGTTHIRFEQKGEFVHDTEPPEVLDHQVIRTSGILDRLDIVVTAFDATTTPLAANFWYSTDKGFTWTILGLDPQSDLFVADNQRTFVGLVDDLPPEAPLSFFFTVQDEVFNCVYYADEDLRIIPAISEWGLLICALLLLAAATIHLGRRKMGNVVS